MQVTLEIKIRKETHSFYITKLVMEMYDGIELSLRKRVKSGKNQYYSGKEVNRKAKRL